MHIPGNNNPYLTQNIRSLKDGHARYNPLDETSHRQEIPVATSRAYQHGRHQTLSSVNNLTVIKP